MSIIYNPYVCRFSRWLKGNLHTHTTLSDGALSPEETVEAFARHGYDFIALTDHDVIAQIPQHAPLICLAGVEHSARQHILRIGVQSLLPHEYSYQSVIDLTLQSGGLVILNHPNWGASHDHWSDAQLLSLERYHGIEIYNNVIDYMEGSPYATDRWDTLLTAGKRVWGYANEDTHYVEQIGSAWNVVNVSHPDRGEILEALKAGRFYASTGVVIEEITVSEGFFGVKTANARELRLISAGGEVIERYSGAQALFPLRKAVLYARVEALGEGKACAWTQPVWLG